MKVTPKKKGNLSSGPILQQTPFWGNLKEYQGYEVRAYNVFLSSEYCREDDQSDGDGCSVVSDDLLVVLHAIGSGYVMAYVPYGPTLKTREECQGPVLEELSEWLREHLPPECLFVRYDLPWASPWADDPDRYDDNSVLRHVRRSPITVCLPSHARPLSIQDGVRRVSVPSTGMLGLSLSERSLPNLPRPGPQRGRLPSLAAPGIKITLRANLRRNNFETTGDKRQS